ncbi:S-adenosyl-L-methionine-dependent methyltransferases superfamily protein [Wolffia australiana]
MAEKAEEKTHKRKRRKESFIYGNYRSYYGYRIDRNVSEDPRLALMKKEWFEGKDCLDVGCNQGLITISIAKKFGCQKILGVDIDTGLIEAAQWNLRKAARTQSQPLTSNGERPLDNQITLSPGQGKVGPLEGEFQVNKGLLPEQVSFQAANILDTMRSSIEVYDTILCLSVTKWIHLNWGDDGLISLFVKIWRLLRPGGISLLEPQPWSSYTRNRGVSEVAKRNYSQIAFTPDCFRDLLLDKIGFRSMEEISGPSEGIVTGFKRPIFLLRK